jgi:hypothetical protein
MILTLLLALCRRQVGHRMGPLLKDVFPVLEVKVC